MKTKCQAGSICATSMLIDLCYFLATAAITITFITYG